MSMPFFRRRADDQMQEFLMACADSLAQGDVDLDALLVKYDRVSLEQACELLALARRISCALTEVTPSDAFVNELRRQLDEMARRSQRSLWGRIRQLPPRTQLAAGLGGATLTAGVVLIASRPLRDALDEWLNRRTVVA